MHAGEPDGRESSTGHSRHRLTSPPRPTSYSAWLDVEIWRRQIFRGNPPTPETTFLEALERPATANSAQARAWTLAAAADAIAAQGRFGEAFELARDPRATSAENEQARLVALFAAAGAGDPRWIAVVRDDMRAEGFDRVPAGRGYVAMADSLIAALEGRWDDARAARHAAVPTLEAVGDGLVLARFGLALGHLAGDHLPEAARGASEAERWFDERGAARHVEAYQAAAARGRVTDDAPVATSSAASAPAAAVRATD